MMQHGKMNVKMAAFYHISLNYSSKTNVSYKTCTESQNSHFVFNNFSTENRSVYKIMWKNILRQGRQQMTIWRTRIASWITKATNTAFGTQVRGFKTGRSRRIFQGEKILSTPSFGGEVKPSVPCRRFTACKRFLNATWKSGISGKIHRPFLAHIVPPLATRISGETTSGESWNV